MIRGTHICNHQPCCTVGREGNRVRRRVGEKGNDVLLKMDCVNTTRGHGCGGVATTCSGSRRNRRRDVDGGMGSAGGNVRIRFTDICLTLILAFIFNFLP
jgi:hypothetical protein